MHKSIHPLQNLRLFLLFISFLAFVGTINLFSQTYYFDNYSTKQGFESKVFSVIQDKQHYVWLGTQTGVTKFDGINFTSYSSEDGLAEGSVRVVYSDRDEALWLGHEGGGITRYNGKTFEKLGQFDSIIRSNITSINQDADNHLWITTNSDGALMIKNPDDPVAFLEYEHFLKGKSLGDQVFGSLLTSRGNLFFITDVGIKKYNKAGNSFESYVPKGMSTYFSPTVMFEDSKGNLWFGTYNGGLSKKTALKNNFQYYDTHDGLASNWITSITEDRAGNIWIGHWKNEINTGGISRIDPAGKIKVFNTSNGLHDDHIWCIREDNEGNMLIGTTEQGLDIFKGERFVSFSIKDGLLHDQVNAVIEDPEGQIWFGTNQGISVYAGENKKPAFLHFNQENKFISNQIKFFRKDNNNNIWIGTDDQGILLYNTAHKQFISQPRINNYLPYYQLSKGITALEFGKEGHLWIGTIDGLVEYDIIKDSYVATYTQSAGLTGNAIRTLFADSKGSLWIGSYNNKKGLTRLHNGVFTIVKSIGEVTPTCITEDKDGKIWIGTDSKGIMVLVNDSVKYTYSTDDGLLSKLINILTCDDNNNIFVGTNRGLNKIDQHNNKIYSYTQKVGFTGIETKENAWYMDSKGYLWLGTANGAIRCDLKLLVSEDTARPEVRIIEMLVKGLPSDMIQGKRLSSGQNDITFKYSSISLTNPEGITYQVMLQGLYDTWQDQKSNDNTIVFNKLQPGRYTFKIRARNENGEWAETPAGYSFRILAPPYKRGYFISTVLCIILASIISFIKIREKNLIQEKKFLEESITERTQALSVANEELLMRNNDITDSITYAQRIQFAILPPDIPFDNTFILFRPKAIVSGDFYWMNKAGDKEFLTAVDCTGHGVPGAFMSFIGFTSLNKIIIEQGIYKPSAILDRLNEEVATTLHQKGEDIVNDGMDIALICYTPATRMVEYAGAFNPLIIVRNGELIETKADRFAIGRSKGKDRNFTNHELQLEQGDSLYLYSDGYADQFGGSENKKFKTSSLKELLVNISEFDADSQHKMLESTFEDWKGNYEQVDDVLVIGRMF